MYCIKLLTVQFVAHISGGAAAVTGAGDQGEIGFATERSSGISMDVRCRSKWE